DQVVADNGSLLIRNADPSDPVHRAVFEVTPGQPGFVRPITPARLRSGVYGIPTTPPTSLEVYPDSILFIRTASADLARIEPVGAVFTGQVVGGCSYKWDPSTMLLSVCDEAAWPVSDKNLL